MNFKWHGLKQTPLALLLVLMVALLAACSGGAPAPADAPAADEGAAAEEVSVPMDDVQEAPMLAELVVAGELPRLEERIPANPKVVQVVDEPGQYGGNWETAGAMLKPQAGQELFLRQGQGAMRHGSDVIQIGPGRAAHSFWKMRATEAAPNHVRVLLTFKTPIDARIELRAYRSWRMESA